MSIISLHPLWLGGLELIQSSCDIGGTAGLALAARLSENGTQSVLVLEAGQLPSAVFAYDNPGYDLFLGGEPQHLAMTMLLLTTFKEL